MDTITHTLFGLTLYGTVDKQDLSPKLKKALFLTTIVGSQLPDIDVISQLWDTEGRYQMWHRGVTHSLLMVPVWAILLCVICYAIWRIKDWRIFWMGMLAVFIHSSSDLFNAWGTGYFEPFYSTRITFGTIPIVDFVFWAVMAGGFLIAKFGSMAKHLVYRSVWILIVLHVCIQSLQGYVLYQQTSDTYEQQALSASFIPWHFTIIGKNKDRVEITDVTLWGDRELQYTLYSHENANIDLLFEQVPEAKTLYEWSPFVVIVDDEERLGVYDPRFYREGQSSLFEYIEKGQLE